MVEENKEQKVATATPEVSQTAILESPHKRIVCHWGGEVDPTGFLSPYEIVGYIHIHFTKETFENLRKKILEAKFPAGQLTHPLKKQIVLDNGMWNIEGMDNPQEAMGFLMVAFSPQSIQAMVHQALNTVPTELKKVKEIVEIYNILNKINEELDAIKNKIGGK